MSGCGGSLIAPGVVLSAAHCGNYDNADVIVGGYRRGSDSTNGAATRTVAETRPHPDYNDGNLHNDFMLLRLETPVTMDQSVMLLINEKSGDPSSGQDLTVLGLGLEDENANELASVLRDVVVQAVDTDECNEAYGGSVEDDIMFCAGKLKEKS